ncbi:MAG: hypothetical protein AB8B62_11160 [Roseobacter sp.]
MQPIPQRAITTPHRGNRAVDDPIRICIIERDLFVSQDMADSVFSVLPSAECSTFLSVSEARSSHARGSDPDLVLISADADGAFTFSADEAKWLVSRKVIAFDARDRLGCPELFHLNKPFSEDELTSAVLSLVSNKTTEVDAVQTATV